MAKGKQWTIEEVKKLFTYSNELPSYEDLLEMRDLFKNRTYGALRAAIGRLKKTKLNTLDKVNAHFAGLPDYQYINWNKDLYANWANKKDSIPSISLPIVNEVKQVKQDIPKFKLLQQVTINKTNAKGLILGITLLLNEIELYKVYTLIDNKEEFIMCSKEEITI